jgi:adenosylhomocysteine nucleosidase
VQIGNTRNFREDKIVPPPHRRASMIAVTFALPEESRDFRRATQALRRDDQDYWEGTVEGREVLIAHTGVGPAAARRAAAELLACRRPVWVMAAGFGGALDPALAIGDVVLGENVSDAALLASARRVGGCVCGGITSASEAVETVAAKAALAQATSAIAVDMETAAIANACAAAGVPLLAVRAISDRAADPLPVPFAEWFDLERQRPRPAALVAYLARHPRQIVPFARFVRGLTPARRALTSFLLKMVAVAESH